jgi:hypothetical protein
MKHKNSVIARSQAAARALNGPRNLVSTALAAIEARGATEQAKAINGTQRSLQAISADGQFSAVIHHGRTTIQFQGDSFAVSTHD